MAFMTEIGLQGTWLCAVSAGLKKLKIYPKLSSDSVKPLTVEEMSSIRLIAWSIVELSLKYIFLRRIAIDVSPLKYFLHYPIISCLILRVLDPESPSSDLKPWLYQLQFR